MNHIEKYRLINTKIKIVSPEYIGITLEGEIVVDSSYRADSQEIEQELKKFINKINENLGSPLHFSDVFGMIDRMKYVSRLNSLRIIPSGNFIKKNPFGRLYPILYQLAKQNRPWRVVRHGLHCIR